MVLCLFYLLQFPRSTKEWESIAADFHNKWNFPNCLGAMDGKHVEIIPPRGSGSYFYNYKKFFSVVLMAIANANYEFIMCNVGTNGRVSDAGVFDNCSFFKKLKENDLHLPKSRSVVLGEQKLNYVFIGDEAFPLRPDLLKPFNQRDLNYEKQIFNYSLSRARRVVENTFGILGNRFRIFHTAIALEVKNVDKVVLACCALHNFLRKCCQHFYTPLEVLDAEDTTSGIFTQGLRATESTFCDLENGHSRHCCEESTDVRNAFMKHFNTSGAVAWQHKMICKS